MTRLFDLVDDNILSIFFFLMQSIMLSGLVKQGLKCQKCRMNVHKKCKRNAPFCTGTPKSEVELFVIISFCGPIFRN